MTTPFLSRRSVLGLALAGALPTAAWAAYPDKPIKLVVPYPPAGAADLLARTLGQRLSSELGQQVVIENRGGAGGALACEMVARAPADGYTLLFGTLGTHAVNPALYAKLRYDPVKDFAPVALTHLTPRVLMVGPSLKVQSVAELIAQAKANPGKFTYGSAGTGSTGHLSGALFETMAGVDMVHVPYKGSAPLVTDILAGRIDATFDALPAYEEHIKSGRMRALAVTSASRISAAPQLPPLAESGLPGYDVSNWQGVFVPAGTPREIVQALHAGIVKSMADPALRKQLGAVGVEVTTANPEQFAALLRADIAKWAKIVKASGAQAD